MSSFEIGLITLGCLMIGVAIGVWLQFCLPGHHLSKESQDTVKLGAGMVATMSALILGLLVSSAKAAFDNMNTSIAHNGASFIQLDHVLAEYGPDTGPLRAAIKQSLAAHVARIWGRRGGVEAGEKSPALLELQSRLRSLQPATDAQKAIVVQARQLAAEIWQNRVLTLEEQEEPVPTVFLVLLVSWLTLLFLSFGLFAPRNVTVFAVLSICALSVTSAVFLILEMYHPLDGLIRVSSRPLLKAVELIGH